MFSPARKRNPNVDHWDHKHALTIDREVTKLANQANDDNAIIEKNTTVSNQIRHFQNLAAMLP